MDENTLGTTSLGVECAGADFIVLDMKDVYHSRNQNRKKLISLKFILHSQDYFQGPTTSITLSSSSPLCKDGGKSLAINSKSKNSSYHETDGKMHFWQDSNPLKCNALSPNIRISSCAFNAGNYATSWFKIFNNSNGY